jgi:hypothetical protein
MCLIAYKPAGSIEPFRKDILSNGFRMNDDGAGYMIWDHKSGKVISKKGFMAFRKVMSAIEKYPDCAAVVHFRRASKGMVINEKNCHPIDIGKGFKMCHNGTMKIEIQDWLLSDSWHFAKQIENCLSIDPQLFDKPKYISKIESVIENNRVVIMNTSDGSVKILNEGCGSWLDGIWYSNVDFIFGDFAILEFAIRISKNRITKLMSGDYIPPARLNICPKRWITEGNDWFSCDHCYWDTPKDRMNIIGEYRLCGSCNAKLAPLLYGVDLGANKRTRKDEVASWMLQRS